MLLSKDCQQCRMAESRLLDAEVQQAWKENHAPRSNIIHTQSNKVIKQNCCSDLEPIFGEALFGMWTCWQIKNTIFGMWTC